MGSLRPWVLQVGRWRESTWGKLAGLRRFNVADLPEETMAFKKKRGSFLLVALCSLAFLVGCNCLEPPPKPDVGAITTVMKAVYEQEGQGRMIFLGAEGEAETLQEAMSRLETDLNTRVRPEWEAVYPPDLPALTPADPETDEVGVMIRLGRFTHEDNGHLRVRVSFSRSGLDGADCEYVLESTAEGWSVIEVHDCAVA